MEVLPHTKVFLDAAQALAVKQVVTASEKYVELCNLQVAVFNCLARFRKPNAIKFLYSQVNKVADEQSVVKAKDLKAPPNHIQTVIDGLQMFQFVFYVPNELKDLIKDYHD